MILKDIALPKHAKRVGWLKPDQKIALTIVLSPGSTLPPAAAAGAATGSSVHLTHKELRKAYGPAAETVQMIESFARSHRLEVTEHLSHGRSLRVCGRAADVGLAFKTRMAEFELDGRKFIAASRPPQLPARWKGTVDAVLGLHNLPRSRPRRRSVVHARPAPLRLKELAQDYDFPAGLDGSGQTIGLIEFGGGFRARDIAEFCGRMAVPRPRISVVRVGSGANQPASRKGIDEFLDVLSGAASLSAEEQRSDRFANIQATAEVTMDLEIVAALVPAAHIVVYFASPTEQGLYHALSRAVHDERHRPSVLSISWGVPEQSLPASELRAIEGVLHEAAHLGITVCASSGDNGALNGSDDGIPTVNYPASSPHCLACGGTSRKIDRGASGSRTGGARTAVQEVVWNATYHGIPGASGGGVSACFPLPEWQREAGVPAGPKGNKGRGLPDVAGLADPQFGCEMLIAGRTFASAGTSSVAPLWAALIARYNQALGRRCGYLHPHLYRAGQQQSPNMARKTALKHVTRGNNGFYRAGKGWNACAGYGTPHGENLLAHLRDALLQG